MVETYVSDMKHTLEHEKHDF